MRELSTLGTTNVKNNSMFERYVLAQERKADAAQKAIELRNRHERFQGMKFEDKILKMNIIEMCPEDQARYSPIQEEIRSQYGQTSSPAGLGTSLD